MWEMKVLSLLTQGDEELLCVNTVLQNWDTETTSLAQIVIALLFFSSLHPFANASWLELWTWASSVNSTPYFQFHKKHK